MSVDPFIQSPKNSQSINPYSYLINNPLSGIDPSGYCGTHIKDKAAAMCTTYGNIEKDKDDEVYKVKINHENGKVRAYAENAKGEKYSVDYKTNLDQLDFGSRLNFDIGQVDQQCTIQGQDNSPLITGTIEPIVGSPAIGFLKSVVNGLTVGVVYGNISTIPSLNADPVDNADIEAYEEKAGLERFAMAMLPGKAAATATQTLRSLPMQIHHFATNKNKTFTPAMERIAEKYGLKLDDMWNKLLMPHLGRHPNEYHQFVLDGMRLSHKEARGNLETFLSSFDKYVKQPVVDNPELLRKSGWK